MQYQCFTFRDLDKLNEEQKITYQFYLRERKEVAEFSITNDGKYMIVKTGESHEMFNSGQFQYFDFVIDFNIYAITVEGIHAHRDTNGQFHETLDLMGASDYKLPSTSGLNAHDWNIKYGHYLADGINHLIFRGRAKISVECSLFNNRKVIK